MEKQNKKELILWEAYNIIRTLNDELYQIKVNADTVQEVANLGDGLLWFGRFDSLMGTMPYYHKENI